MDYTNNLNLKKPNGEDEGDFVNIDDINGNMEIIDGVVSGHIADTNIHVTAEKQAAWDQNTADIAALDTRLDLQERILTATIPTTGWSATAPYYVEISVPGLMDSRPNINPIYSETNETAILEDEAWANISKIKCLSNVMIVYCFSEIPNVAINVEIVGA